VASDFDVKGGFERLFVRATYRPHVPSLTDSVVVIGLDASRSFPYPLVSFARIVLGAIHHSSHFWPSAPFPKPCFLPIFPFSAWSVEGNLVPRVPRSSPSGGYVSTPPPRNVFISPFLALYPTVLREAAPPFFFVSFEGSVCTLGRCLPEFWLPFCRPISY